MKHINTAFPEEKRPMMYKMMKWWGGKPHSIWSEYIKNYSSDGDIVLDPFCGRGVGVIEAVKNHRKGIGVDLNPIAIYQTKMISSHLNIETFKTDWINLKKELKKNENDCKIFYTKCIKCGKNARLATMNYDRNVPYKIFYHCECKNKAIDKIPDQDDIYMNEISNKNKIITKYPNEKFPNTGAFDVARKYYGETYDTLFTKRNLYALSIIFDAINKVKNTNNKNFFRFAFISMVHLASKLPSVRENSNRTTSGSWGRPAYIKVRKNMELNPFVLYERAIEGRQGIISGKKSSNILLGDKIKFAKSFDDLKFNNLLLLQDNSIELTKLLRENSVDFVITDPPYGGLIPYFDLSYMWSSWLKLVDKKFTMLFSDEITIDDCRNINFDEYHRRLNLAFGKIFKVLKNNKYMIVTFHNDKPQIFNSLIRACQDSGFILEKVLFQMNRRAGETGVSSPWGTSVSDFYIRFRKPKINEQNKKGTIEIKFENIIERIAKEVICKRGEPTQISAMIPHIYDEMGKAGMKVYFQSGDKISDILKNNNDFIALDNNYWWLSNNVRTISNLDTPLSDRVEDTVIDILRREYKIKYDDVLKNIFEMFPNSLTPNSENVKDYLNEYGKKVKGGSWQLKPEMIKENVTTKHTEMEVKLAQIGKYFGYDIWSPDKSRSNILNKICMEFKLNIPHSDRIKLIDVLWLNQDKIKYVFEIENSTAITSALERCSHVRSDDVKRIIVLPETRKQFLTRKLSEPLFSEYFKKDNWNILYYNNLVKFSEIRVKKENKFNNLFTNISN